ncbi:ABC transporter permease, partial [Klebsiella pneumoniae]|nr:ABC transporter permease [Klebsiella pneumoniae]
TNEAARLLTEMKILHKTPDINTLYDAKYVTQP